ncbi:hypothetical protein XTPLMG730_3587 [Xanthomonas translucens pv. phlei]|uniref:NERD domain-containing protein n=2 Tax=Xanthomonas translucens group TaxID=3390202 RepID=A0A0K3AB34_9XANT|nr:hypothetical protein XTPLMG730_3587 [Xanthomonas translucens pv. phlei]
MVITLSYPALLPEIRHYPGGILPKRSPDGIGHLLIIKMPKEYILAAKLSGFIKMYLAPVEISGAKVVGLLTAFFDDHDEPLTLVTPLMDDDLSEDLFAALNSQSLSVHFFDEHSREHFVFKSKAIIPEPSRQRIAKNFLLRNPMQLGSLLDAIPHWFSLRTDRDDLEAIVIEFSEMEFGDVAIQDLQPKSHQYHGARGYSHTQVERKEPGSYQEEDIIRCLSMCFEQKQIYHSPLRCHDKEEVCDILVVTRKRVLIVQAKDSPNTEAISHQKISRKRSNVMHALNKAIGQVKGALGYIQKFDHTLDFFIGDELHGVNIANKEKKTLIVVKELFNDQYFEYSPPLLQIMAEKNVDVVALDYPELYKYCAHLADEEEFFEAYDRVVETAKERGEYPRLRFGVPQ